MRPRTVWRCGFWWSRESSRSTSAISIWSSWWSKRSCATTWRCSSLAQYSRIITPGGHIWTITTTTTIRNGRISSSLQWVECRVHWIIYENNRRNFLLNHVQVTELVSTAAVLHLANTDNAVTQRRILSIIGVSLLHILAGGTDQFISNVIQGEGYAHQVGNMIDNRCLRWVIDIIQQQNDCTIYYSQVVRDLGFMIPDILHVLFPLLALMRARLDSHSTRSFFRDYKLQKDVGAMIFSVVLLFTVCSFL